MTITKNSTATLTDGLFTLHETMEEATQHARRAVAKGLTCHIFEISKTIAPKVDVEETTY